MMGLFNLALMAALYAASFGIAYVSISHAYLDAKPLLTHRTNVERLALSWDTALLYIRWRRIQDHYWQRSPMAMAASTLP